MNLFEPVQLRLQPADLLVEPPLQLGLLGAVPPALRAAFPTARSERKSLAVFCGGTVGWRITATPHRLRF